MWGEREDNELCIYKDGRMELLMIGNQRDVALVVVLRLPFFGVPSRGCRDERIVRRVPGVPNGRNDKCIIWSGRKSKTTAGFVVLGQIGTGTVRSSTRTGTILIWTTNKNFITSAYIRT